VEKVKAAFLELAKVFHPDRLPPALGHLSAQMRAIFEAVREAYDTLQSDPRRALYIASMPPPPKAELPQGADSKKEAAEAFKRGENLMRKRDYAGAEKEFLIAFELDAQAVYLAATAWAVYMDPARRHDVPRAKQMMANALTRDPNCDRAHYQLGVIARVEGEMDRAEKHFREAIRIAPKHLEANQELRLIQIRKKKDSRRKLFGGKSGK
jgi:curved DNA-binding protein CbpA